MKILHTLVAATILRALTTLPLLPTASAQNSVAPSPEFAPLTAKYQSAMNALAEARNKAIAPLTQSYLAALAVAEQKARSAGKADEAKAATEEKDAVTAGRTLATAA